MPHDWLFEKDFHGSETKNSRKKKKELRGLVFADLRPGDIVYVKASAHYSYPKDFSGPKLSNDACDHLVMIHAKVGNMLWVSIVSVQQSLRSCAG
jgi:hypothetical protein